MRRYSAFAIAREALRGRTGWERAWRDPAPRTAYEVVIVGAGGHGLATAYYLARNHGVRDVAVEKGWLGGGNTGRNSVAIYEKARGLYETLSQELHFKPARRADVGADRARVPRLAAHCARQPAGGDRERAGRAGADQGARADPEPRRFKAIPGSGWATAEMLAKGAPGELAGPSAEGRMIDESVAAAVAH